MRCYRTQGVWGVSKCSGRPIFIFFIKENWICAMTRYHADSNINILLTKNLPIDSNRTTERVVNLNMALLGFDFVLILF